MAPTLRCPRCSTVQSAESGQEAVCPSCGFAATVPPVPQMGVVPSEPVLTPVPAGGEVPAWARRGKVVHPAVVVVLALATLGVYALVYWWRVSKETDLLRGHRHAHRVLKVGLLLAVLGTIAAVLAAAVGAALAYGIGATAEGRFRSEDEALQAIVDAALPFAVAALVAVVVALVGCVMVAVGQYRSWDTLRSAERAAGQESPINPGLYLFLPLGLALCGAIPGFVGVLLGLAGLALGLTFMAITQAHLNRIWQGMASAPAPAPAAQ
jgi:hypothetical protein